LKRTFNLTLEQYNQMFIRQNGVCAICGLPEMRTKGEKVIHLAVDHNHKTNRIRGLLCWHCNTALGHLRVDNEGIELLCSAISYLKNMEQF
jgi:predicted class III extradiol MEMO1 family dioxygenase